MPRAILKNGVILPLEPLPADWEEGTALTVERQGLAERNGVSPHGTDRWMDEVEALAAQGSPDSDEELDQAIAQIRQQGKDLACQGIGSTFLTTDRAVLYRENKS
jgi:hypothetical protein